MNKLPGFIGEAKRSNNVTQWFPNFVQTPSVYQNFFTASQSENKPTCQLRKTNYETSILNSQLTSKNVIITYLGRS